MDNQNDIVRLSVNLPREEAEALRRLAADRNMNITETVRDAIATERFVAEQQKDNAQILVRRPGEPLELVSFRRR